MVPYDPAAVPRIRTMIPALDELIGGLACYITMHLTVMPELSAMEREKAAV